MIREPMKTSASLAQEPPRPLLQFRAIAPAPSSVNPTPGQGTRSKKRKARGAAGGGAPKKRQIAKPKKEKPVPKIVPQLPTHLWVTIAEHCTPKDRLKLNLLSKGINVAMKNWEGQVAISQIVGTYGPDMPTTFANLSPVDYASLLSGGKGCAALACRDAKASKIYWPFKQRWCFECWTHRTIKVGLSFTVSELSYYSSPAGANHFTRSARS